MNRLLNEIEEMKHVDYSGCATRRKHIMLAIKNHDMHALRAIVKEGGVLNKRDRLRLEPNPIKLEYGVAKEALQSYVAGGKLAKRNGLLEAENKTLKATNEELQKQLSMLSARNAAMAKKEKKIENGYFHRVGLGKLPLGTKDGRREQQFEVSVLELKTEIRKLEGQLQAHKHQNRGLMSLLSEEREKYSKIELQSKFVEKQLKSEVISLREEQELDAKRLQDHRAQQAKLKTSHEASLLAEATRLHEKNKGLLALVALREGRVQQLQAQNEQLTHLLAAAKVELKDTREVEQLKAQINISKAMGAMQAAMEGSGLGDRLNIFPDI